MNQDHAATWLWGILALVSIALITVVWRELRRTPGKIQKRKSKNSSELPVLRSQRGSSGLQSDILAEGTGPGAKNGDQLTVHYTVSLTDGTKIDSSYDKGRAFEFKLGIAAVIIAWDEALQGAKVGERRILTCPSKLAYGNKGSGRVPKNSTLIFEIEVLNIEKRR